MAYIEEDEESLFGLDQADNESLILEEEETTPAPGVNPKTDPKSVTPASDEDKRRAKETPDEKMERLAEEQRIADEKLAKELEDDWNDEKTDLLHKKPTTKSSDPKEDTPELEGFEEIADGLYKVGIFNKEEDDEPLPTTQEEFVAKFQAEKERGAEELVGQFAERHGPEYKELFDAVFVDGVTPLDYLRKFEEIKSFKNIDLTDVDNQVKVIETDLRKQGWEEDDIAAKIKRMKLNSELESESLMSQKALVRRESTELAKIQEKSKIEAQQKVAFQKLYKNTVHEVLANSLKAKELSGIPITKELALKTQEFLTDDTKWKLASGELISDFDYAILELNKPQNHEAKVLLGLLIAQDFEPGKPIKINLGKLAKTVESKQNKEIFNFTKKSASRITNKKEAEEDNLLKYF